MVGKLTMDCEFPNGAVRFGIKQLGSKWKGDNMTDLSGGDCTWILRQVVNVNGHCEELK